MPLSGANGLPDRESYEEASRRAASEPLQFDPITRVNYIRDMVARVLTYKEEGRSNESIQVLLPGFVEEYKNLFEMITAPEGYDTKTLDSMLALLGHMHAKKLNQHEASVIIGKRLYEKYGRKE